MSKSEGNTGFGAEFIAALGTPTPHNTLQWMMEGRLIAELIYVAAKLSIPDLLKKGPRSAGDLIEATGAHADALPRILRGLVWCGILAEREDGRFELTEMGDLLREDAPAQRFRLVALVAGYERPAFAELLEMAKTGEPAFNVAYRMSYFDYLRANPDFDDLFNQLMQTLTSDFDWSNAIVEAYDFSTAHTIVDVGGGLGHLLAGLLKANPKARGVLFDLPEVVDKAAANLEKAGLAARCAVVSGDIFESVPAGGDYYIIKHVLNDWDDQRCVRVLRNCRAVLPSVGRVLVINSFLPERATAGAHMLWSDVYRLVQGVGRERSRAQFESLFETAGLRLATVHPTDVGLNVLEAVPV